MFWYIQVYMIKFEGFLVVRWLHRSFKTERHDITEILLKLVLNNNSPNNCTVCLFLVVSCVFILICFNNFYHQL